MKELIKDTFFFDSTVVFFRRSLVGVVHGLYSRFQSATAPKEIKHMGDVVYSLQQAEFPILLGTCGKTTIH